MSCLTPHPSPAALGILPALGEYADRRRRRTFGSPASYAAAAPAVEEAAEDEATGELPTAWSGVIGVEGTLTGDGRLIEEGALEWTTPIPLRYVKEDVGGHDGAVTVGRILGIERDDEGNLQAYGDFDHGSEEGREAARLVGEGILTGVSMDLDSISFEVRVAGEVYDDFQDMIAALDEGVEDDPEAEEPERDAEGRVTVAAISAEDEIMVTTSGRVRAATIVAIPAFAEATIAAAEPREAAAELSLVASAAPIEPPAAWFAVPEADAPTALTITDDGQVYGHLATWDQCHIADPSGAGICVMAPRNTSGYAYFHTGAVKTSEGGLVPTGTIRFNTGHAKGNASAADASAHYDNTGLAGADIHATDGKHGIWVAGALRPNVTAEQIRTLRAAPLSGDWRYIDGKLELVGALSVNLPGFPVPRPAGLVASGEMTSLVAAGMLPQPRIEPTLGLSSADAAYLSRLIEREKDRDRSEAAARAYQARSKVKVAVLSAKRRVARARRSL